MHGDDEGWFSGHFPNVPSDSLYSTAALAWGWAKINISSVEHCWGEIPQEYDALNEGFSEISFFFFFAIVVVVLIWWGDGASGRCCSFEKGGDCYSSEQQGRE